MSVIPAGTKLDYTITFLDMASRPDGPPPTLPADIRLERCQTPPVWFFLSLYDAVGRAYEWVDKFHEDPDELRAFVQDPKVSITVAYRDGWPNGFFMLDWREAGTCDLAYFGLVPEAIGARFGSAFLKTAIHHGWDQPGVTRLTVNTCTLDHPRALGLYQKLGFRPYRTETHSRILTRDRDPSKFPT